MKKMCLLFCCIVSCFFLIGVCAVYAEGEESTDVSQEESSGTDWQQELNSDKQQLNQQREQIKQNSQEARAEEGQLKEQIQAAIQSGDMETARQLKEKLRNTHQENVQQMIQDKKDMKLDRQDFKNDVKDARQEAGLPPKRDRDNNPPGAMGGPGTNWENKPGPQGGPGTSPNRRPARSPQGGGGGRQK